MESLYRDKRSCHLRWNLGVYFYNTGIIWVHHKFWPLLLGVVILYPIERTYGFSFDAVSKVGYVKPSEKYSNLCLLQLPEAYVYRKCSPRVTGPLVLDEVADKIYFWEEKQFLEVRYYETRKVNVKVITHIELGKVPQGQDIHLLYIPGNPFIAMIQDPHSELYSFYLLPEENSTISGIPIAVPYRAGLIFGIEYSNIVYVWIKFEGNQLHFLYFNTKSKQNKFFYYSLERVPIPLKTFTISELGGVEKVYFAGSTRDFQQVCLFVIHLQDWNQKVERGQPLEGNLDAYFCGNFSAFDRKGGFMEIEIFSIIYPYSLSAQVLSQKFPNNYSSIIYFIYPNLTNKDHKFTKTKECGELYPKPESRYIICQVNGFQADYYNSVRNGYLITRFEEKYQHLVPHPTCYLFNDCYGCRLMELFNCSWEEDECVNTIKPRKPFKKCIKVTKIASTDKKVTLDLEGVRLTNTFMVVQMLANSTGEIYTPISISDYQASFGINISIRKSTNFTLQISNFIIRGHNLVELRIDFVNFKNQTDHDNSLPPLILILVSAAGSIILIILVVSLVIFSYREANKSQILEPTSSRIYCLLIQHMCGQLLIQATLSLLWTVYKISAYCYVPYGMEMYRIYPSQISGRGCLIQMSTEYLYRQNCNINFTGPTIYDRVSKKIRFWRDSQSVEAKYFEMNFPNQPENLEEFVYAKNIPPQQTIHLFFIPRNSLVMLQSNPQTDTFIVDKFNETFEREIKIQIPYSPGIVFGDEGSSIVYVFRGGDWDPGSEVGRICLGYLYAVGEWPYEFEPLVLHRTGLMIEKFFVSEFRGLNMTVFAGFTANFDATCIAYVNHSVFDDYVRREDQLHLNVKSEICIGNFQFEREGRYSIEMFKIKYPYNITGYLLTNKHSDDQRVTSYFLLPQIMNFDHPHLENECYLEKESEYGNGPDLVCRMSGLKSEYDYFTSVIDNWLIKKFDEKSGNYVLHNTCFLFNDCYGCRLVEALNCSWTDGVCIESVGSESESYLDCITAIGLTVDENWVTGFIVDGVRFTNTFMEVYLYDYLGNETYENVSIADRQAFFPLADEMCTVNSNFSLMISNSEIYLYNFVEVPIDPELFRNITRPENILIILLKIFLFIVLPIFAIMIVLAAILLYAFRDRPEVVEFLQKFKRGTPLASGIGLSSRPISSIQGKSSEKSSPSTEKISKAFKPDQPQSDHNISTAFRADQLTSVAK